MTERRFDALRFEGPGTDLTVGLLRARLARRALRDHGRHRHMPNLPTEEVFTTPDPERVDGVVTATKPLYLGGSIIRGLKVRFEGGRAVQIDADENADVLRAYAERDEGADRLGEVALVDREGRIGPLGTVFYDTLLDENAASHIALGSAYAIHRRGQGRPRAREHERDPRRLHDRRRTTSTSPAARPTATTCRSCAAAAGSSRQLPCACIGEVPEWLNGARLEMRVRGNSCRGFESLSSSPLWRSPRR